MLFCGAAGSCPASTRLEDVDAVAIAVPVGIVAIVVIVATGVIVARTMIHRFRCITLLSDGPLGPIVDRFSPAAWLIP